MNRILLKSLIVLGCLLSLFGKQLYADQAKFKIEVINPGTNRQTVDMSVVFIDYRVTNMTGVTRTLTRVLQNSVAQDPNCMFSPALAANACQNVFTLQPGQSCNLCMQFFANKPGRYTGGPAICKVAVDLRSPDPFLCSQPTVADQLDITVVSSLP
ncbi:MAG: hypothetical protein LCH30_00920 [Proteobacteria bacterium]|nr:hypothetical protein [Pseudomonadota bacterium]